jgi:hypothetical protein
VKRISIDLPLKLTIMKKFKYILLYCLVMTGIIARSQTIQMRIPALSSTVGSTIDVPVYVDNSLTGLNVLSFQLKITYNNSYLSYNSVVVAGTMVAGWGSATVNNPSVGTLFIAHAGTTPLSGTGILFYIRFQCVASGTASVAFSGGVASNFFNEGSPVMTFVNGSVAVSPAPFITVSPNSALLSVGETQQFTVSGGTPPYTWSVTNPAVANISTSGLLTATSAGFTKVSVHDNGGITDQTDNDIEIRAMKLTLPTTSAWQGSMVEVPITTTSLTGLGIIGGNIKITFNQNILTPVGYNSTGTLLSGYSNILLNTSVPGSVTVAFAGTTALTGSGVLINLQFNVSSVNTGSSTLAFTEALFNETMLAKTVNGSFSTINFSTISITPNTATLVYPQTQQFNASGGVAPYTWNTSDNTVATINSSGLLTVLKSGVIQVTATDNVGATGTSGNITIYDTWVTIPSASAQINSTYDLPVMMSALPPGQSVFSVQGTVSYKTPELTAIDIVTAGTMANGWTAVKVLSGNQITFAIAGTTSFSSAGVMFKIQFQLNPDLTSGEFAYVNINNIMLNEGIPLPRTANGGITGATGFVLNLNAYLEGPFNGTSLNNSLYSSGLLPLSQPYNFTPWSYPGSEGVAVIPNANVVDWVLIELRDAVNAGSATVGTRIARQAAFLLSDGSIVGMDGFSDLIITATITNNLFAIVWHKNHLGVMSAVPVTPSGGIYSYDFTTGTGQAYGVNAQKQLAVGKWGMFSGDGDANNTVNTTDKIGVWTPNAGKKGYLNADFNRNGQVSNQDKNNYWLPNNGKSCQVP